MTSKELREEAIEFLTKVMRGDYVALADNRVEAARILLHHALPLPEAARGLQGKVTEGHLFEREDDDPFPPHEPSRCIPLVQQKQCRIEKIRELAQGIPAEDVLEGLSYTHIAWEAMQEHLRERGRTQLPQAKGEME